MDIFSLLNGVDFLVMGIYLLVILGIGSWVSWKQKHTENLFLAQHSLGAPSIGLTMWGTNVGPSMLIASCGIGYTTGIVAANFSWYAFVFIFLLAFLFAPYYLQSKTSTLPEFIGKRFNQHSRELLAWYSLITILVSWLGMTLYAGGILVTQIMNWPLWLSVTALVVISAFFTLTGGLKTVAHTNVFQMSLLIVASFTLVVFGLVKAGGVSAIWNGVPQDYWKLFMPSDDPNYPWYAIILGYPVLGIWFWCTDQSMVQSVLAAKSLRAGRMGTALTGYLKILDMFLFILPGIICFVIFPDLEDPDESYMTMVSELLPHGLIGLTMTVLMAALISTVASALNSLSTVFTLDVYQKRFKPNATTEETIKVGRVVTIVASFVSIFLALGVASLEGLDLFSLFQAILGFLAPPLSAVFLIGVLWKRANSKGANAVLTVGTAISLGIGLCYLLDWPSKEVWPHFLFLSFLIFMGLCLLMIVVSLLTLRDSQVSPLPSLAETYRTSGKVGGGVWTAWGLLVVLMIGLYAFFNLAKPADKPNFIVIFVDDLGYGDLGCYGSEKHRTPNIDRMASEGMRFTDFYVSSGVCTPSRSSLLTGSYPRRLNLHVDSNDKWVLFPAGNKGLHPDEVTIAEILKKQGYATACIGKWHLGDQPEFLPTRQGFDSYYGIPYSNDMDRPGIPLPLMREEQVIEAPLDQQPLTQNYTTEAIRFIEENKDQPFFLYLPHTMVHIPLYSSPEFEGKSANGKYGDALEEVDWSTGEILAKLKEIGIDEKTVVVFCSDNGADERYGGSNAPFSGFKGDTDEGGMRVPFIVRWPDQIPENTKCGELAATLDILPTFAALSGGKVPEDRIVDGKDIWPLLSGEQGAKSPHKAFFYYHTTQLQAVRSGKWKLILPLANKKRGWAKQEENVPLRLIDLTEDVEESGDVSEEHPRVVEKLMAFAETARADLGDLGRDGSGQRDAGWVTNPKPQLLAAPTDRD